MNPSAKLSELIEALEFESEESVTRFDRQTGRIVSVDRHILSAFEEGEPDELGDLPDWQKEGLEIARAVAEDAGERFIDAPDKFDFSTNTATWNGSSAQWRTPRPRRNCGGPSKAKVLSVISKIPRAGWDCWISGTGTATKP